MIVKKTIHSLRQRGFQETFVLCTAKIALPLRLFRDRAFDRKFGTNTSGLEPLNQFTIFGKHSELGTWSEPADPKTIERIFNTLGINFQNFILIDYGSGKGRVLLIAAQFGFKRIEGIEFAKELHEIACRNIAIVFKRTSKCTADVRSTLVDATEFVLPSEQCVLIFFSPFREHVLSSVLENVRSSFEAHPRLGYIVFLAANKRSLEIAEKFCSAIRWRRRIVDGGVTPLSGIRLSALIASNAPDFLEN